MPTPSYFLNIPNGYQNTGRSRSANILNYRQNQEASNSGIAINFSEYENSNEANSATDSRRDNSRPTFKRRPVKRRRSL